jgi:hypothetical protein
MGTLSFPGLGGTVSLGLCGGVLYYTLDMNRKRLVIRALAGSLYQDNDWGFGHVVTLFIWVPLLISFWKSFW